MYYFISEFLIYFLFQEAPKPSELHKQVSIEEPPTSVSGTWHNLMTHALTVIIIHLILFYHVLLVCFNICPSDLAFTNFFSDLAANLFYLASLLFSELTDILFSELAAILFSELAAILFFVADAAGNLFSRYNFSLAIFFYRCNTIIIL